ncbi:MAG: hypothetical protein AVDCRST_MAG16-1689, partial [uncultured Frankineae bacterium]
DRPAPCSRAARPSPRTTGRRRVPGHRTPHLAAASAPAPHARRGLRRHDRRARRRGGAADRRRCLRPRRRRRPRVRAARRLVAADLRDAVRALGERLRDGRRRRGPGRVPGRGERRLHDDRRHLGL